MNNIKSSSIKRFMMFMLITICIYIIIFAYFGFKKLDIIIDNQETIINIQADNIRQTLLIRVEIEEIKDFWQGDDMTRKKEKIDLKDKSWKKEK